MQGDFEFKINGARHRAGGVPAATTLLQYLRDNMLTASKGACEDGACGACSVLLADRDEQGEPALRVTNACLLTLPMVAGREIWTAEGLASGERMHPVQEALASCGRYACGYCLPGVSAALVEAFEGEGCATVGDAVGQSVGNLCRCTGYRPFRDALIAALRGRAKAKAAHRPGAGARLPVGEPEVPPLVYRDHEGRKFYRPSTLREALRLRQAHPAAALIAGGTSRDWGWRGIGPGSEASDSVISLESIAELVETRRDEECWEVGAAVSIARLAGRLGEEFPMFREMAERFGSTQIRNRATVGGNIVSAPHHSDLVPVLLALGAEVRIAGIDGERDVALDEFFVDYRHTALGEGEVVKSVRIPRPPPVGTAMGVAFRFEAFYKVSKRRYNDRAIVNAAFRVELDGDGLVSRARLCFGGVAAYPARAYGAEILLRGGRWEAKAAQKAAAELKSIFPGSSDQRATAAYRNALVAGLWQKFYAEHRKPGEVQRSDSLVRRFQDRPVIPKES